LNEETHLQTFVEIKMAFPKLKILFGVKDENNHFNKIQDALDLGFDGLYFDLEEPIDRMISNIKKLQFRTGKKMKSSDKKKFDHLRKKIDKMDEGILKLLSARRKSIRAIAEIKNENNMKIFQASRWKAILNDSLKLADKTGINKDMLLQILSAVHSDSIKGQAKIYTRISNK
jgi:chorismate mutase